VYRPYRQQCIRAGCILLTVSSVDVQGVSSLPPAVYTCRVYPPYRQQCRRAAGCILLTITSIHVHGISSLVLIVSSVDVQGVCISFHHRLVLLNAGNAG
jgi:hypothetical protein